MSLLERCRTLQLDRKKLVGLKKNTQETSNLKLKYSELQAVVEPLPEIVQVLRNYKDENIPLQPINGFTLNSVSGLLRNVKERFAKTPKYESLVQGKDWPPLINGIKGLSADIREVCIQGWTCFTEEYFNGHSPELIQANFVKTQENVLLLLEYKNLVKELRALARVGGNVESVQDFKENGARLKEVAKKLLEFQAPENVKAFLAAIGGGGASLDLFTVDVANWLKTEGLYNKFKIVGGS